MTHSVPIDVERGESMLECDELESTRQQMDILRAERDELATAVSELRDAFATIREEMIASQEIAAKAQETTEKLLQTEQTLTECRTELQQARTTIDALQQQIQDQASQLELEREAIRQEAERAALQSLSEARETQIQQPVTSPEQDVQFTNDDDSGVPGDTDADALATTVPPPAAPVGDLQLDLANAFGAFAAPTVESAGATVEEPARNEVDDTALDMTARDLPDDSMVDPGMVEADLVDKDLVDKDLVDEDLVDEDLVTEDQADQDTPAQKPPAVSDYISELFGVTPETPVPDTNVAPPWAEPAEESPVETVDGVEGGALPDSIESAAAVDQGSSPDDDHVPVECVEESAPEAVEESAQPTVRSEIAELFGLTSSAFAEKPATEKRVTAAAELMSAVDDYSQEEAAAVSMSFEEAERVLLKPDSVPVAEQQAVEDDEPEDEHDDFVSQYMEQLLSRNRQSAGSSLPEELKRPSSSGGSKAKPKSEAKPQAGKSASFIDQYMSGAYSGTDQPVPDAGGANPTTHSPAPPTAPPRQKIDLEKMREAMNSFREVSTRSTENALATHARRQQRGGIAARTTILTGLSLVCLLIMAASLTRVIPFGILAWLSLTAVAVSGGELMWKLKSIRSQLRKSVVRLQGDSPTGPCDVQDQTAASRDLGASDVSPESAISVAPGDGAAQGTIGAEPLMAQSDLLHASDDSNFRE